MCDARTKTRYRRITSDIDYVTWFARQLENLAHCVTNIVSANVLMETLSKQWEAYRRVVTSARNRFCADTRSLPSHR